MLNLVEGFMTVKNIITFTMSLPYIIMNNHTLVFFKRLGSRHIHKEIKSQEDMNGIDYILCKADVNLIRGLPYKCNAFNKRVLGKGVDSFLCNNLDVN